MQLGNKLVWITGASSGIGEQLAYECIKKGAKVILSARNIQNLTKVKHQCDNMGGECHMYPIDLSDIEQVENTADEVITRFGTIDLLINNGGVSQRSLVTETIYEVERKIMETNFFGTVALTRKVLPQMVKNGGGHIAVTSSITGKFGYKLRSSYAASKHALHGYFDSLRLELTDRNIHITIVCPGRINTGISKVALAKDGSVHGKLDEGQEKGMPVGKCSEKYIRAIERNKREVLIGGKELLLVHIKNYLPFLFYKIARRIKAT